MLREMFEKLTKCTYAVIVPKITVTEKGHTQISHVSMNRSALAFISKRLFRHETRSPRSAQSKSGRMRERLTATTTSYNLTCSMNCGLRGLAALCRKYERVLSISLNPNNPELYHGS